MFILPIGMIEEHGPHLPVASDTFVVEHEAADVSKGVSVALPQLARDDDVDRPLRGRPERTSSAETSSTQAGMASVTRLSARWLRMSEHRLRRTVSSGSSS